MTQFANLGERTAGDDYVIELAILDSDGQPLNINGLQAARFGLFRFNRPDELMFSKSLGAGIAVVNGPNGEIDITWNAADTADLNGTHSYEVEITDLNGKLFTPVHGIVTFRRAYLNGVI